ncbi:hypothetical protein [Celeribacter sp. ULVN23_4]
MTNLSNPILIALVALTAAPALADGPKNKKPHGDEYSYMVPKGCHLPPGIEKQMREGKRHELPPGLDKKCYGAQATHHRYDRGDHLPDGYKLIRDYDRYGLPDPKGDRYVISDDTIYKIARDGAIVISVLGIANNILGN